MNLTPLARELATSASTLALARRMASLSPSAKSAFTPRSAATATRSSSVSCIDLVINLMCADQNASGVWASSASSAARNERLLSVSGLWRKA